MENENVRKELKINQNILKMLWCIENAKINIQSKFHVSTVIFFKVTPKTKFNFVKNRFCVKIPVFP